MFMALLHFGTKLIVLCVYLIWKCICTKTHDNKTFSILLVPHHSIDYCNMNISALSHSKLTLFAVFAVFALFALYPLCPLYPDTS